MVVDDLSIRDEVTKIDAIFVFTRSFAKVGSRPEFCREVAEKQTVHRETGIVVTESQEQLEIGRVESIKRQMVRNGQYVSTLCLCLSVSIYQLNSTEFC